MGLQDPGLEGLDQEVIAAGIKAPFDITGVVIGADDHDRGVAEGPYLADEFEAVKPREVYVGGDKRRIDGKCCLHPLGPGGRGVNGKAAFPQDGADQEVDVRVVLNDHRGWRIHAGAYSWAEAGDGAGAAGTE